MGTRSARFSYLGLEVDERSMRASFRLDDRDFSEIVEFSGVGTLERADVRALGDVWFLLAGLSYYKAGAAHVIDLGDTPVGPAGRALLRAALTDGLGEFAVRNDLDLSDVQITGGRDPESLTCSLDPRGVLTPFGGGIDSVVTMNALAPDIDQRLFIVSPPTGRFEPIEATAAISGLEVARATRHLDARILRGDASFFNGHVPVTAMITLLAAIAALADGRGGVAMSNEHSASFPNLLVGSREINHQWSKSWVAEQLIADAITERVGPDLVVASTLRDRSELWVAREFAQLTAFHSTFRSCNRAFAQDPAQRARTWCGECDKCLFIALVLAPFIPRPELAAVLGVEPLSDPRRHAQLATLVGSGETTKPFECVGDPAECSVALCEVARDPRWRDVEMIARLASSLSPDESLADMLASRGVSRVPAAWLR